MSELSDDERQEIRRLLNSVDQHRLELVALSLKYDTEWYEQRLDDLDEMDRYFSDVGKVANKIDRGDLSRSAEKHREQLAVLIETYEDAIDNLSDVDARQHVYNI